MRRRRRARKHNPRAVVAAAAAAAAAADIRVYERLDKHQRQHEGQRRRGRGGARVDDNHRSAGTSDESGPMFSLSAASKKYRRKIGRAHNTCEARRGTTATSASLEAWAKKEKPHHPRPPRLTRRAPHQLRTTTHKNEKRPRRLMMFLRKIQVYHLRDEHLKSKLLRVCKSVRGALRRIGRIYPPEKKS